MPQFRVVADKLWHSGECKHYHKGDVVTLPEGTVAKDGGSIEAIEHKAAAKTAKGKAAQTEGDKPEGTVAKDGGSIEAIEHKAAAKTAKGKAAQTEGDKPEGGDESLA